MVNVQGSFGYLCILGTDISSFFVLRKNDSICNDKQHG